jgi:hypothetical protein
MSISFLFGSKEYLAILQLMLFVACLVTYLFDPFYKPLPICLVEHERKRLLHNIPYPNLHFSSQNLNIRIPIMLTLMKNFEELPCYGAGRRKPPDVCLATLGHLKQGASFSIL